MHFRILDCSNRNKAALPVIMVLSLWGLAGDSRAQQTFPLVCRGGSSMRFASHSGNAQHTYNILGLFFKKGTRATGPDGAQLAPGQCSWLDRAMRTNEPDILQEQVGPNVTSAPWFDNLKKSTGCWRFDVFNTNQGVLKVTSQRPCKSID
jgi:hypothetical protein